jgi:hypothetical protein
VDYYLLSHQIVFPLLHNLHQGIELLVIGRVVKNFPMKYFRMVAYSLPPYIKTTPITYPLTLMMLSHYGDIVTMPG